jgi:hypothetical protein
VKVRVLSSAPINTQFGFFARLSNSHISLGVLFLASFCFLDKRVVATFHQYAFWIKSDVLAWLGSHTVSKARDYVDHVQELSWNDKGALLAQVPGSNAKPYNVHITFVHKNSSEFYPVGACSCPVGYNCKHVAATLLACINNPVVSNTAHGALGAQLTGWLSGFSSQAEGVKKPKGTAAKKTPTQTIVYALVKNERQGVHTYRAEVYRAHIDRSGQIKPNGLSVLHNIDKTLLKPPLYATDQDLDILRLFWSQRARHEQGGVELSEEPGHDILQKMQATGRLYCLDSVEQTSVSQAPLQLGAQREGRVHWGVKFGDLISPTLQTEPAATYAFLVDPFWYLDRAGNVVGPVGLPYPSARLRHYFTMPPITLEQADDLAHALSNVAPELPKPPRARQVESSRWMCPLCPCWSYPVIETNILSACLVHFYLARNNKRTSKWRACTLSMASIVLNSTANNKSLHPNQGNCLTCSAMKNWKRNIKSNLSKPAYKKSKRMPLCPPSPGARCALTPMKIGWSS